MTTNNHLAQADAELMRRLLRIRELAGEVAVRCYHAPMHAEDAYLVRHALLRDAAYQMQMPADRAKLHELAFYLIEETFGGRAPEPPALDAIDPPKFEPHPTDAAAAELAEHARIASRSSTGLTSMKRSGTSASLRSQTPFQTLIRLYLRRAAEHAEYQFRAADAAAAWQALVAVLPGSSRGEALRRAGVTLNHSGHPRSGEELTLRALNTFREVGNRRAEGVTLGNLASFCQQTGRMEQAERIGALARASRWGSDSLTVWVAGFRREWFCV